MAKKGMRGNPKNPKETQESVLDEQIADFVDYILLKGKTLTDAYRLTHEKVAPKASSRYMEASRFAAKPEVQARMQEVKEEMRQRREEFRERLIKFHFDDIENTVEREGSLTNCMEQVKSIAKILGLEQTKVSVEAKVGALDDGAVADKIAFLAGKAAKDK